MLISPTGDLLLNQDIRADQQLVNELQKALQPFLGVERTSLTEEQLQATIKEVLLHFSDNKKEGIS